jgi:hypothetical protein
MSTTGRRKAKSTIQRPILEDEYGRIPLYKLTTIAEDIPNKQILIRPTIEYDKEKSEYIVKYGQPNNNYIEEPFVTNDFDTAFEKYKEEYDLFIKSNLSIKLENNKYKFFSDFINQSENENLDWNELFYSELPPQRSLNQTNSIPRRDIFDTINRIIENALQKDKEALEKIVEDNKDDDNEEEDEDEDEVVAGVEAANEENEENFLGVVRPVKKGAKVTKDKKRGRNNNNNNDNDDNGDDNDDDNDDEEDGVGALVVIPKAKENKPVPQPVVKKVKAKEDKNPLEYQGIQPELFFLQQLQLVLLLTGLNDFNHDFGHEKILDYLKNVNINLGNISISSVEFEKKRLQFAMGSGGKSGSQIVKQLSETYFKLTKEKIKNDLNLIPEQWRGLQYLADIGKKVDPEFGYPNIYKIYKGIRYSSSLLSSLISSQGTELELPIPLEPSTELQQITNVVGFPFQKLVDTLNPEPTKPFSVENLDPEHIVASLNKLEETIVKKLQGLPDDITEIADKSIKFIPTLLKNNDDNDGAAANSLVLEREYYIHPVPVKIYGKRVYLPGAIKRAVGDNPKILILIDASNLSMKSLGEKIKALAANYTEADAIQVLILFNNANLADSAMKLSKSLILEDGINLKILFGTEDIGTTTRYPRPDRQGLIGAEIQNKALFNNFNDNITKKESMKRISADITYTEYTNAAISSSSTSATTNSSSSSSSIEQTLHINDLSEESEISSVSAKIVLDYLELNGKVSTKSMVRGQTKKSGDSNQAISLLDENRTYYYCNILGEPVNEEGERVKEKITFTLGSLKSEGWVVYLLTHDKVLLSIALILGINVLYTLKLLFRFSEEIIAKFGEKDKSDDEDTKSKSITWLIGFQNAKDNIKLDETQVSSLREKYYTSTKQKISLLKAYSNNSIAEIEKYFRNYIVNNFFNQQDMKKIRMDNFLQVLYCYFDVLTHVPKDKEISRLDATLDSSIADIENTGLPDSKRKAAMNLLEKTSLDLNRILTFFNDFGLLISDPTSTTNEVQKTAWKAKMDILVNDMIKSIKGYTKYGIKSIMYALGGKNYDNAFLLQPDSTDWTEYKDNYEKEVNNLKGYLKYFDDNHIKPFQNSATQKNLKEPSTFLPVIQEGQQSSRASRSSTQQTPVREKLKILYTFIYELRDKSHMQQGGAIKPLKEIFAESTENETYENAAEVNTATVDNINKIKDDLYWSLSKATVTVIRDDGRLLDYYNYLVNQYYFKVEELKKGKQIRGLINGLNEISKKINLLYSIFNNPNNKPIYDCNGILPIDYCLDELGNRFELTPIFSHKDDIYVEIPLLYPKISGEIGNIFKKNENLIRSQPEFHLIFEKLRLYYYETKLVQYYEKKRAYLHFMVKQFFLNNRENTIPKDINIEKLINLLQDNYLEILEDIILNYTFAFNNCFDTINVLSEENAAAKKLMTPVRSIYKVVMKTLSNTNENIQAKVLTVINNSIDTEINKIRSITHIFGALTFLSNTLFDIKKEIENYYVVDKDTIKSLYNEALQYTRSKTPEERSCNFILFDEYAVQKINYLQDVVNSTTKVEQSLLIENAINSKLFNDTTFLSGIPLQNDDNNDNNDEENNNEENNNEFTSLLTDTSSTKRPLVMNKEAAPVGIKLSTALPAKENYNNAVVSPEVNLEILSQPESIAQDEARLQNLQRYEIVREGPGEAMFSLISTLNNDDYDNYFNSVDSIDSSGGPPSENASNNNSSLSQVGLSKSASEISLNQLDSGKALIKTLPRKATVVDKIIQPPSTVATAFKKVNSTSSFTSLLSPKALFQEGGVLRIKQSRKKRISKKSKTQKRVQRIKQTRKH